jgi:hypothetical protein
MGLTETLGRIDSRPSIHSSLSPTPRHPPPLFRIFYARSKASSTATSAILTSSRLSSSMFMQTSPSPLLSPSKVFLFFSGFLSTRPQHQHWILVSNALSVRVVHHHALVRRGEANKKTRPRKVVLDIRNSRFGTPLCMW